MHDRVALSGVIIDVKLFRTYVLSVARLQRTIFPKSLNKNFLLEIEHSGGFGMKIPDGYERHINPSLLPGVAYLRGWDLTSSSCSEAGVIKTKS